MGDGLMAFWGVPEHIDQAAQARLAVNGAIAMHHGVEDLTRRWRERGLHCPLRLRIGINQGFVTLGNIGSAELTTYMAVGRAVNVAKRLESSCQPGEIWVSLPVQAATRELLPFRDCGEQRLKGLPSAVHVSLAGPDEYAPELARTVQS